MAESLARSGSASARERERERERERDLNDTRKRERERERERERDKHLNDTRNEKDPVFVVCRKLADVSRDRSREEKTITNVPVTLSRRLLPRSLVGLVLFSK